MDHGCGEKSAGKVPSAPGPGKKGWAHLGNWAAKPPYRPEGLERVTAAAGGIGVATGGGAVVVDIDQPGWGEGRRRGDE